MKFSKFSSLLLVAALLPFSAGAQDSEAAYTRLNLAGDLRIETQHMARLACYIGAGFQIEQNQEVLRAAIIAFRNTQQVLMNGDEATNLPAENDAHIIAVLNDLADMWPSMATLLKEDTLSQAQIAEIDLASLDLLEKTETLTNRIANANSEATQDLPLIMALSIDMAGRQIMRTEKAAKEACLIGSGIEALQNRQKLQETVTVFSATMEALISGFPGMIVRPPSLDIESLLQEANTIWSAPKDALSRLYMSGEASLEDRMVIGGGLEAVVRTLREVAVLYQDIEQEE